ncbi:MAG: hypothetical protein PHP98_04640, partial [Kiritimatiellae bacterium]|nr:hypothetical protein [Kiritimatiellia bacterium]
MKMKITMVYLISVLMSLKGACSLAQDVKTKPDSIAVLISRKPVVSEHSLFTSNPGKVNLDLWGWETTPFYQRV